MLKSRFRTSPISDHNDSITTFVISPTISTAFLIRVMVYPRFGLCDRDYPRHVYGRESPLTLITCSHGMVEHFTICTPGIVEVGAEYQNYLTFLV